MDAALEAIYEDAREFGAADRQGPWRLGLRVARSVQVGKGWGVNKRYREDVSHETSLEEYKVSASEFAHLSGTTTKRVMKHLRAWNKAAKEGCVLHSTELRPGQELGDLLWERLPDWEKFYEKDRRQEVGHQPTPPPTSQTRFPLLSDYDEPPSETHAERSAVCSI